jgi:DNA-binding HxlR family transcriptional regulator
MARDCSLAAAMGVIGERWALLALREVFLGVHRFDAITEGTGAPRDVLSARLKSLVEAGILHKVPYSERPLRHEYHLTEAGLDLRDTLLVLSRWGERWLRPGAVPEFVHTPCDHRLVPVVSCQGCGEVLEPGKVRAQRRAGAAASRA